MKSFLALATLAFGLVANVASAGIAHADTAHPGDPRAGGPDVVLHGAGATFPAPLYRSWIAGFQKDRADIAVEYDAIGSGDGMARFVAGTVDFGASDAIPTKDTLARLDRESVRIPGAAGMVVLAYNLPGVDGALRLPRDVYADILAGVIGRWDDARMVAANPGLTLPHRAIALVARSDRSGTTWALTNHLSAISPRWSEGPGAASQIRWPDTAMLVRGNEGVASRIMISPGSIGYLEYGFAQRLGLKMAALQNRSGAFVAPGEGSGQAALGETIDAATGEIRPVLSDPAGGGAWPMVTYSWLMLYGQYHDAARRTALKSFVLWGLTRGQERATALGYLTLPAAAVAQGRAALERIH
jgi:phosphate transport system substrate-binding protein